MRTGRLTTASRRLDENPIHSTMTITGKMNITTLPNWSDRTKEWHHRNPTALVTRNSNWTSQAAATLSRDSSADIVTGYGWVPGALSLGPKGPGRETDHSPPSGAEVKNGRAVRPLPNRFSWRSAQFIKQTGNFTFLPYAAATLNYNQ
jgi:hypothetical protein